MLKKETWRPGRVAARYQWFENCSLGFLAQGGCAVSSSTITRSASIDSKGTPMVLETASAPRQASRSVVRRLPVGADVQPDGGVHFRVWAPRRSHVEVLLEDERRRAATRSSYELRSEENGYFSGLVTAAAAGSLYRYRLDGAHAYPDPASRHQPQGPHGPSRAVDPSAFHWTDDKWRGTGRDGQIIYEMHIG